MKNITETLSKNVDRRVAAKIIGLTNPNLVSVWVGREFLKPDKIEPAGGTKKQFLFSFTNLVEMALLKELNEAFSLEYLHGSLILNEAFGPGRKRLAQIIREGKGYLLIGKTYEFASNPRIRLDITYKENKLMKYNVGLEVKLAINKLEINEIARYSEYILIINLEKIIKRLLNRI